MKTARQIINECDTAFEMIRIQGYDVPLSPQAVSAINEVWPKVKAYLGESNSVSIEELVDQVIARQSEVDEEMLKRGTIAVRWGLEDVESQEDDENPLTEAERIDVLSLMDRKHDAEIGINWDVISCWIDYVISERVNTEKVN